MKPKDSPHVTENELTIHQLIENATAPEQDLVPKSNIGLGQVGRKCARRMWYRYRRYAPHEEITAKKQRIFDSGHLYEERVIKMIQASGFELIHFNARSSKGQYRVEHMQGVASGYIDGFVNLEEHGGWHILDAKSINQRYFNRLFKYGIEDKSEWIDQVQLYMGLSNSRVGEDAWPMKDTVYKAMIAVICRNSDDWHPFIVDFDKARYYRLLERIESVARAERPPEREGNGPEDYTCCRWCDYAVICWGRGRAENVNCRSCRFAELKVPGDKGYFGNRAQWICDALGRNITDPQLTCDQYTPIEED